MKKFLYKAVLFLIMLVIMDFIYGKVMTYLVTHAKGGTTKAIYDVLKKDKYDILIMGSSRAKHHYIPSIISDSLNMSCYNLGQDGNGIILMDGLYKILSQRYHPKIIIYDVEQAFDIHKYKNDDNCTRYLSALRPYFFEKGIDSIFKSVSFKERIKQYSSLMRYNSTLFYNIKNCFLSDLERNNGYSGLIGKYNDEQNSKKQSSPDPEIDSLKISFLQDFLKTCTRDSIKLYIVASPKYGATSTSDFGIVKEYCEQYGAIFVDEFYSDSTYMNTPEWFKEPMHLNTTGAVIFSEQLAHKLKTRIKFIHRRSGDQGTGL